jgi:hypothetical protein
MSDEFGTVSLRRGERAREIEVMRQHYRAHREALARMTADAPTDRLAMEYQRLIGEIDSALMKLNELEPTSSAPAGNPRLKTEPGMRPLVTTPIADVVETGPPADLPPLDEEPRSRVPLILGAMLLALVLIGWLVWRASSDRGAGAGVVEETTASTSTASDTTDVTTAAATTAAPIAAEVPIAVSPASHDYGVIRKGTRATRQFEVANNSEEPISIAVARSTCRCLFYEHAPVIPPKAKETLTVTIDGAKAKAGELRENVKISLKHDASVSTTVSVNATIQ